MLNFIMLQIEILADAISKFGLLTILLAGIGLWIHRLTTNDELVKKQDRERLLSMLDKYEAKLGQHDKFKEDTIKELILLLKENHQIIRETNEINKESIRILSIISSRNSHAL